jgi:hypothetical protein
LSDAQESFELKQISVPFSKRCVAKLCLLLRNVPKVALWKGVDELSDGICVSFDALGTKAFDGVQLNKIVNYGHKEKFCESLNSYFTIYSFWIGFAKISE